MSLIDILRADQVQARKTRATHADGVRVALLTTLLGEAVAVGKNQGNRATTDEEVLKLIGKFLGNARETQARMQEAAKDATDVGQEIQVLEAYLLAHAPRKLNDEELEAAVRQVISDLGAQGAKDMGRVMAELKARHTGAYDGAKASALCKRVLSN